MSAKKKTRRGRPKGSTKKMRSQLLKIGFNVRFTEDDAQRISMASGQKESVFIRTATLEKLNQGGKL